MTDDEKKLLRSKNFKPYMKDMDYDEVIAWKRDVPEKNIKVIISVIPEDRGYDLSYKDENNKDVTVFNDLESIEDAIDACDDFLDTYDIPKEDLDAVKSVFNNEPRKIAEDIDELCRSIDDKYDRDNPDKDKSVNDLEKQIKNGEIEAIQRMLLKFDIEEMEAELNMRNYMIQRLTEYKAMIATINPNINAELDEEGNYNSIDGIIGNSGTKVNIKMMISAYQAQISGNSTPTQRIDELELRKESET